MKIISLLDSDNINPEKLSQLNSTKIFSFDILSHKLLESKNLKHYLTDDFLSYEERKKIFDHVVSKLYWYNNQTFSKESTIDGTSVFEFLDPLYLHQKLIVTLTNFLIIKKIIETEKPQKIFLTKNLSKIVSTINNKIPIIYLNSDEVEIFDTFDLKLNIFSKIIPLKISMKKLRKLQNIYESIMGSFNNLWLDTDLKKPIILLLEFDPTKFSKLLEKLNSKESNCVILNRRKSPVLNSNSLKTLKKSNIKLINFSKLLSKKEKNEIVSKTKIYDNFLYDFWDNEKSLEKIFSYEDMSYFPCINDFLKKQFASEIKSNVELLIQSKYIFRNFDVKCILYQYESGTSENIILSQRNDVPALLIRHGFASFSEKLDDLRWRYDQFRLLKLDCDEVILWGDADYNYYTKFLSNDIKLQKIGSPRHDLFFQNNSQKNRSQKIVLITTPPIIEWTGQQNINLELRYEQVLKQIIKNLQQNSNLKLIAKLHPGWGWKFNHTLMKIFHDIDPNIPVYSTKPIIPLIEQCDLMININPEQNQPSTVILEGLIMKKPVINVELDELNNDLHYDSMSPIISLSYKSDIQKYVSQLFNDPSFYENLNKKSAKFLEHYLSNHKNASNTLAKYLKSFV